MPSFSKTIHTLYPYPDGIVIATKGGVTRPQRGAWDRNGRPEHLRTACERSLRRLKLERSTSISCTRRSRVPLEDSVGALAALQTEGKTRHIGISNVSIDVTGEAVLLQPGEEADRAPAVPRDLAYVELAGERHGDDPILIDRVAVGHYPAGRTGRRCHQAGFRTARSPCAVPSSGDQICTRELPDALLVDDEFDWSTTTGTNRIYYVISPASEGTPASKRWGSRKIEKGVTAVRFEENWARYLSSPAPRIIRPTRSIRPRD
jgi:hypothetical protein